MKLDKIAISFFQVTVLRKSHRGGFSGVCETYTLISVFISFKKKTIIILSASSLQKLINWKLGHPRNHPTLFLSDKTKI